MLLWNLARGDSPLIVSVPHAGRHVPEPDSQGGRGLCMVNHLTDLSQIRTGTAGTTVRLTINP